MPLAGARARVIVFRFVRDAALLSVEVVVIREETPLSDSNVLIEPATDWCHGTANDRVRGRSGQTIERASRAFREKSGSEMMENRMMENRTECSPQAQRQETLEFTSWRCIKREGSAVFRGGVLNKSNDGLALLERPRSRTGSATRG